MAKILRVMLELACMTPSPWTKPGSRKWTTMVTGMALDTVAKLMDQSARRSLLANKCLAMF